MKLWNAAAGLACASLLLTPALRAEEPAAKPAPARTPAAAKAAPAKAPLMDEKAIQEVWMKMATPGDAHKWIAKSEGTWDCKVTMYEGESTFAATVRKACYISKGRVKVE